MNAGRRKPWVQRLCLLTGTSFLGKDGHFYGPSLRRSPVAYVRNFRGWAVWLYLPWGRIGLHTDDGMGALFSERYGLVKVWRFRGLMLAYRPKRTRMYRFQNTPR